MEQKEEVDEKDENEAEIEGGMEENKDDNEEELEAVDKKEEEIQEAENLNSDSNQNTAESMETEATEEMDEDDGDKATTEDDRMETDVMAKESEVEHTNAKTPNDTNEIEKGHEESVQTHNESQSSKVEGSDTLNPNESSVHSHLQSNELKGNEMSCITVVSTESQLSEVDSSRIPDINDSVVSQHSSEDDRISGETEKQYPVAETVQTSSSQGSQKDSSYEINMSVSSQPLSSNKTNTCESKSCRASARRKVG